MRKPAAARVRNDLFRYPFGLAVSEIEKLHIPVEVGLIQDRFDGPAKHEGRRDVIEFLGPSFERQPQDLVGSHHVRVTHAVVVEQVVHGRAVVEHRIHSAGKKIPDVLRQAQHRQPEFATDGNDASLKHLHQPGRARPHRFHRRPQPLFALDFIG